MKKDNKKTNTSKQHFSDPYDVANVIVDGITSTLPMSVRYEAQNENVSILLGGDSQDVSYSLYIGCLSPYTELGALVYKFSQKAAQAQIELVHVPSKEICFIDPITLFNKYNK